MILLLITVSTVTELIKPVDNVLAMTGSERNNYSERDHLTVILQLFYLDGEVSEEIVTEKVTKMEDLWNEYRDWKLVDIYTDQVILKKEINDISPLLKANGYFGLTEDGTLSIFNGRPENMDIIQSFFQIDINKLESKKQQSLRDGIPVRDKDQFQEVLKAFKPYTLIKKE